jgi:hypothetical protein
MDDGISFYVRTVLDWIGTTAYWTMIFLALNAFMSLMLPAHVEVLTEIGFRIPQQMVLKGMMESEFDPMTIMCFAMLPFLLPVVHGVREMLTASSGALSTRELAAMRGAAKAGWVIDQIDDDYICYGPQDKRVTCDHLRDLEDLVKELSHAE